MTQKLALYFLGQGDGATRVLEADHQPEYVADDGTVKHGWTIGRLAISAICFRNGSVSKEHGVLSAKVDKAATLRESETMWVWELTDRLSTNGTYLESPHSPPYRIAPGVPYEIHEGSVAQFGAQAARVKFSFDIDDTHSSGAADTDPQTGIAAPVCKPEPKVSVTGQTLGDVLVIILTGPPDLDKRIWWALCLVIGLGIFWILER